MKAKNVLVTGGRGFIGRNVAEHLGGGYVVYAPDHATVDLLDEHAVEDYIGGRDIDVVIHCANVGGSRATGYDAADIVPRNLRMFFNLARCVGDDARMIYMGSGAEYDMRHYIPKMKEEYFDTHVPEDGYGFSKYAMTKYAEASENILCLRLFGVYGRCEDYKARFISNAIVKSILGLPIVINQNVVFDYLYADDLVRIVERMMGKKTRQKHINVTPTKSIDLVSAAELVNEAGGTHNEIKVLNTGMNTEYTGDNSRLRKEIPDIRFTPYKRGIKELYRHYESIIDSLDKEAIREDPYLKHCRTSKPL